MKSEQELAEAGFTDSGRLRYQKTIEDYAEEVYTRSVKHGEIDKDPSSSLEVTHEHVRESAYSIAQSYGKDRPSRWTVVGQIGEYIFTAIAGIGGGNLTTSWGTPVFGISLALAVILIAVCVSRGAK